MAKNDMLRVRMTEEQRQLVAFLAVDYNMETANFVRAVFDYIKRERPPLTIEIVPEGKHLTPTGLINQVPA